MNELVKALKNFIVRHIIYIVGGAFVILSFLYLLDQRCILQKLSKIDIIQRTPTVILYVVGIGLAYVIAYSIQEIFCFLGLARTALYSQDSPHRVTQFLYKRYMHRPWESPGTFDPDEAWVTINREVSKNNMDDLERRTYLMQISTTIGSCGIVSGIILLMKSLGCELHIIVPVIVILFSTFLLLLGRVKLAQLTQFVSALYSDIRSKKKTEEKGK